ncbi:MAG: hypothetical protein KF752_09530 [Pirellulaceae bacterium]|nr:hypothetical protein [Pirellulaceae bacterium]
MVTRVLGVAALLVGLTMVGKMTGLDDYPTVVYRQAAQWLSGQVPPEVEIERLGLYIERLDTELADSQRTRAESGLQLSKARKNLANVSASVESMRGALCDTRNRLKDQLSSTCSSQGDADLTRTLKKRMEQYKLKQSEVERLSVVVARLEKNHQELDESIQQRQSERDLLAIRLQAIRSEMNVLALVSGGKGKLPSRDNLVKGKAIAEKIEDILTIERAVVGLEDQIAQQASSAPVDALEVVRQADSLLGSQPVHMSQN